MGETITAGSAGTGGQIDKPASTDKPAGGASAAGTETRGAGSGTGTGAGAGTGTKTEQGKELSAVANVDLERAEARRKSKAESAARAKARKDALAKGEPIPEWAQKRQTGTGAQKTTATQKKKEPDTLDSQSIQKLLKTVFDLVAMRPNCAHWALSDAECKQLAEPLHDILKDYAAVNDTLSQNSKYIALVMTAFAICAPRIVISSQMAKMRKVEKHGVTVRSKTDTDRKPPADKGREAGNGSGQHGAAAASNGTEHLPSIYELVSEF